MDAGYAVAATRLAVDRLDLGAQLHIGPRPARQRALAPRRVPRWGRHPGRGTWWRSDRRPAWTANVPSGVRPSWSCILIFPESVLSPSEPDHLPAYFSTNMIPPVTAISGWPGSAIFDSMASRWNWPDALMGPAALGGRCASNSRNAEPLAVIAASEMQAEECHEFSRRERNGG